MILNLAAITALPTALLTQWPPTLVAAMIGLWMAATVLIGSTAITHRPHLAALAASVTLLILAIQLDPRLTIVQTAAINVPLCLTGSVLWIRLIPPPTKD